VNQPWRVLAASVAGGAHARAAKGCQDAFAVEQVGDEQVGDALVVAVADGAGSAPLAAVGAVLAAELTCRRLAEHWRSGTRHVGLTTDAPDTADAWRGFLDTSGDAVLRQFRRAAGRLARSGRGLHLGDLGTTLTAVVVHPPWLALFSVGDGFVVTRTADGHYDLLLAPPGGPDRPPGATTLLTSPGARTDARRILARIPDLTGVAVGSDGMDRLVLEYEAAAPTRPCPSLFDKLFGLAEDPGTDEMHLTAMLAGQRVNELTEDDRTLVLSVPR
jgi:hypothetical protein